MNSIECAKVRIQAIIAGSEVPEDPQHAENTLEWLFRLAPKAGEALQLTALAHDIERAIKGQKVCRSHYGNYDAFKAAHARNGADILRAILDECRVAQSTTDEACRLVTLHEVGGDPCSDLLKDADSISFFQVNMPSYYQREGWVETKRRCAWGYRRLSPRLKTIAKSMRYENENLTCLLREVIAKADLTGCNDATVSTSRNVNPADKGTAPTTKIEN